MNSNLKAVFSGAVLLCLIAATSSQDAPEIPGVDPLTLENLVCFSTEAQSRQAFLEACINVDFDAIANSTVSPQCWVRVGARSGGGAWVQ